MNYSNESLEEYLGETLHMPTYLGQWAEETTLPGYLRGRYRFFEGTIGDARLLFLHSDDEPVPSVAKKDERTLQQQWSGPVVFAFDRITPRGRQRMIREGLAFVVPGSQIYLPFLGTNLQERYKPRAQSAGRLRPSAQAMLLYLLTDHSSAASTPGEFAKLLGYTPVAMGQALDQLESAELVRVHKQGRQRLFELAGDPAELWLKAQPLLTSPVKRRRYVTGAPTPPNEALTSGLSALAAHSLLADPPVPVVALSAQRAKSLLATAATVELVSSDEADLEIEVWTYAPELLSDGPAVDRLSLYLSLRDDPDERVQSALDQMMRAVTW